MQGSSLNLLIVEDVWEDVQLMALALEEAGTIFTYDNAETAQECQEFLKKNNYDALLSDYRIANGNAKLVLKLLKESGQEIPLILVTGTLGEEAAVECIKAGMTDYVLKERLFRLPTVLERALQEFELRRQKKAAIAQLQQQVKREAIINRIVQAMRQTLVLEEVLQTTLDQLHEELDVSTSIFMQYAKENCTVNYVSQSTIKTEKLLGLSCPACKHYEDSLKKGKSIFIEKLDDNSVPELIREAAGKLGVLSAIFTPVLYQQSLLGIISLHQWDRERKWTENELTLIQAIADACAIAIHQAELYQKAQAELRERKRIEAQLRHDAFHDPLTGLPNRALLLDRLEQAIKINKRRLASLGDECPYKFAVLFIDLDGFKVVNDSLGHVVGDRLLGQVACRIKSCMRASDTVARLGGDEFVVLIEDLGDVRDPVKVAERLHQVLVSSFTLEGQEIFVGASIGIVLSSSNYERPSQILRDADIAMYQAKNKGRGRYEIFNDSMHKEALKRLKLENSLRRALELQELKVFYQPIISLASNRLEGFEALVRWQHPQEGLISPADFIPIAEETGLICAIDLWVFQEACEQLRLWQQKFPSLLPLRMSVNLSGRQFSQSNLISDIDRVLKETKIPGQFIKLEITESILIRNASLATEVLKQLRQRNIEICLDDFGTGYSSLSYLHRFPIKTLKIDRYFVKDWHPNSEKVEIVRAIVNLGLNLGLNVIAEGIETAEQSTFLKKLGCHSGQGFWFYPPLSGEQMTKLLIPL